jgi:hypothetical protein
MRPFLSLYGRVPSAPCAQVRFIDQASFAREWFHPSLVEECERDCNDTFKARGEAYQRLLKWQPVEAYVRFHRRRLLEQAPDPTPLCLLDPGVVEEAERTIRVVPVDSSINIHGLCCGNPTAVLRSLPNPFEEGQEP